MSNYKKPEQLQSARDTFPLPTQEFLGGARLKNPGAVGEASHEELLVEQYGVDMARELLAYEKKEARKAQAINEAERSTTTSPATPEHDQLEGTAKRKNETTYVPFARDLGKTATGGLTPGEE
jgi:hypothetical protein